MSNEYLYKEGVDLSNAVSVSQLQSFMACPKKWAYSYVDGVVPRVEKSYLTIGKLCHKGMEVAMVEMWNGSNWEKAMCAGLYQIDMTWDEYVDMSDLGDVDLTELEDIKNTARRVFEQAFNEFEPWKYEVVSVDGTPAVELHFVVPCADSILHGFIDVILKEKETGFIWCVDYKFRKSLAPDDDEAFNIQNATYSYACKKLGIDITGTMTWQHLNVAPADPQLLKNGGVSRAKIKTTWQHYARFCEDHGIDWKEYEDEMREKLSDIEWFRKTLEYRNDRTVEFIWTRIIEQYTTVVHSSTALLRSMYPWNCKMCQYKTLCQAEVRGYDVDHIINSEYTTKSPLTANLPQ